MKNRTSQQVEQENTDALVYRWIEEFATENKKRMFELYGEEAERNVIEAYNASLRKKNHVKKK